jgi:hypothetical protein
MNHIARTKIFSLVASLFLLPTALAWTDHYKITGRALQNIGDSGLNQIIPYESLEESLTKGATDFSARTPLELKIYLKIRKHYGFANKLAEEKNAHFTAGQILSQYSDEPDWEVDQELFNLDEYPELWRPDTKYIAGQHGTASQGFRHMYFPGKFLWRHPIASFQIPMHSLGEAPYRADLFYRLSQLFFKNHSPYWGYRFLAWSLHYIEDLFQPFHVSQTPDKRFIEWDWGNPFPFVRINLPRTLRQLTYYHFSYEWWASSEMNSSTSRLLTNLQFRNSEKRPSLESPFSAFVFKRVIGFSLDRAARLGNICYRLFPKFDARGEKTPGDVVGSAAWENQSKDPRAVADLEQVSGELFVQMGQVLRSVVLSIAPKSKPK